MTAFIFTKDPVDILDYVFDYTTWLAGDTVISSVWDVESGLVKVSDSHTGTTTTVKLSGGTLGEIYTVSNVITTNTRTKKVCSEFKIVNTCA